ncbi:MAG TPA: hypothetical protein VH255_07330, partial [Verrucomicrobiae bacterium]|nr:hypothetical protein [Verrucomicrobiae bacterium]
DLKGLHDKVASFNGWLIFLLMVVMPLVGVPVSFLFVTAGVKFGPAGGLGLAAVAIAFHLAGSYWIGNSILRKPLVWLFSLSGYKKPQIPPDDAVPICALIALVPGLPYAIKNYGMVMGDVKFWPFFLACLPTHFISVTPVVLFGGFSGTLTLPKIIFLVVYFFLIASMVRYVAGRLRKRRNLAAISPKVEPDLI